MKKIINLLVASAICLLQTACGPSRYTMHLDMRQPSRAGIDLAGKSVSVVFLENGTLLQDAFLSGMAEGFAASIENEYGSGEGSVGIYKMPRSEKGDYSDKDTLVNLLVDTGVDVVFLMDTVKLGVMTMGTTSKVAYNSSPDSSYITTGTVPYTVKMYSLDAMDKTEEVKNYGGTSVAQASVYSDGKSSDEALMAALIKAIPAEGWTVGQTIGDSFRSQWKTEGYSVAYFDSSKWMDALEKADQLDWKGAMEIWFELLESNDVLKRSCASYNIALACYMLGDYSLADDWLDLSDKESELPMSSSLRKRIAARK